jgi:1-deoxy-D-xylulose-5-phosphate synthase
MAPSDEDELQHALATAVSLKRPVALRYPRARAAGVPMSPEPLALPLGKGRLLAGEASEPGVLVVAAGTVVKAALAAVRRAQEAGLQAALFDARYVKPLDGAALQELGRRAAGLVTVEENVLAGGFGAAVLESLADAAVTLPRVRRLGLPDTFIDHGAQEDLLREVGLDADAIFAAIQALAEPGRRS